MGNDKKSPFNLRVPFCLFLESFLWLFTNHCDSLAEDVRSHLCTIVHMLQAHYSTVYPIPYLSSPPSLATLNSTRSTQTLKVLTKFDVCHPSVCCCVTLLLFDRPSLLLWKESYQRVTMLSIIWLVLRLRLVFSRHSTWLHAGQSVTWPKLMLTFWYCNFLVNTFGNFKYMPICWVWMNYLLEKNQCA